MRSITLENLISYLVTRCSHSVVTFEFLPQNVWEVEGPGILSFYDWLVIQYWRGTQTLPATIKNIAVVLARTLVPVHALLPTRASL